MDFFFLHFQIVFKKVTKVATDHQKYPNFGQKWYKRLFFCPKGKQKGLGRSPPQELKEGQRSGSHLLVEVKEEDEKIEVKKKKKNNDNDNVLKSENKQDVSVEHEDPTKHEEEKKYKGNFQMTFIQTCF